MSETEFKPDVQLLSTVSTMLQIQEPNTVFQDDLDATALSPQLPNGEHNDYWSISSHIF